MADDLKTIFDYIEKDKNFLLSGGAGSGKTYTLVQVLKKIYEIENGAKVACITYTNVATDEIKERASYKNLHVSTIHDFLWSNISNYQKDLKKALVNLIESGEIRYSGEQALDHNFYEPKRIKYREWKSLEDGIVSHDEVIKLSEYLFKNYPLLSDVLKDKYDFILIDEYQDTFEEVINIFVDHLNLSKKTNIIGFFGDSMQSIYPHGVGSIQHHIDNGLINKVIKEDNRRNPESVLKLINQLRNDGLVQTQANDESAPNYNLNGSVSFIYQNREEYNIEEIKELDLFSEFDFNDYRETKELYLVHNLISEKAGFSNLMEIYDKDRILDLVKRIKKHIEENDIDIDHEQTFGEIYDLDLKSSTHTQEEYIRSNQEHFTMARDFKFSELSSIYIDKDQLIGQKNSNDNNRGNRRDALTDHLFSIQDCIYLYNSNQYNKFINKTGFEIKKLKDKQTLKSGIEILIQNQDLSIGEVIELADEYKIWKKDDNLNSFIKKKEYVYKRVKDINYNEFEGLYNYVESYSPYSTQHNIKGAEFDNVFVVLDNGGWNHYNFSNLFEGKGKDSILNRTRKLFYVCCSRAKKNLVVFFINPSVDVLTQAEIWFGKENVYNVD